MFRKILFGAVSILAMAMGAVQAQDLKEFRVGILGGENEADRLRNYQCFADHIKQVLGVEKVSLFPAADYDGVIQGLLGGTLDFAELGASAYAKVYLENKDAVQPILTTIQTDGSTGYRAVMVARADSGIKTLADMKGKKLGFADPDSTSGYLIPVTSLPKDIGMDVKSYFASTGFGGGHEQLVLEVLKGTFDAGTTWASGVGDFNDGYSSGNLRKMVDKGVLKMDDLVELWQSPLIPNGPLVLRTSIDAGTRQKITDFLTKLPQTDPACFSAIQGGDYKGYSPVTPEFYQPIIDARKAKIGS
ncbi:phosphonate ABC transporter substrate-binding protein [Mesorhizobium sp.]|uniref:phosphonate ABC transporter substrate-binding protein n=1 Tax=Mesorhizobium sp. TaxID=1871066 RepID=UPI000FE4BC5A|nr:phosphonate ABC transporter substrate-binding protein [Mesorhizobium sp.]RWI15170.1 MAG: phosphonate ABC transporter substrate-binding protein [Mesorhizobium sp.]RWK45276.1 MAG: phosphonate ABC transporter substrate-binding protein [Mesorhizobium sp.]RWK90426.1 MAG: phosphonate ABC transporter substrate-binding protein [Mesorhizobium sp.]RWK93785.1 MAG: phosphonate ABC transporter substrate-binding protein [Mesorhizobium sp.]TIP55875.1 MAG: phosphonate ABC transporter substrate-binding prot